LIGIWQKATGNPPVAFLIFPSQITENRAYTAPDHKPGIISVACCMTSPPPSENLPGRVDELDGLRGLLALWVAFSHLFAWCGFWETTLPRPLGKVWPVFIEASAAVDTFIILSGFAISFLLHKRAQSYGGFMTGRVFRIYPVYLVCLVLGIASTWLTPFITATASWQGTIYFEWIRQLAASESAAFGAHTFWHLTLLNGLLPRQFLPDATGTLLTPAWSITLEWQYYLLAPFIARLVFSSTGLLALTIFAALGSHFASKWQNPQLAFFPAHLPLFLIGIGSYHFHARVSASEKGGSGPVLAVVILITAAVLLKWHSVGLVLWALGFGCILARGNDPFSKLLALLRRILLHPLLQKLGKISFPLYLVHWPIIIGLLALLLRVHPEISSGMALILLGGIGFPIILAAAWLLHRFVELPGMAMGKKFVRRPPAAALGQLETPP
jgi:peptidoglycan/LPS O-acetylase OafA/YrhL